MNAVAARCAKTLAVLTVAMALCAALGLSAAGAAAPHKPSAGTFVAKSADRSGYINVYMLGNAPTFRSSMLEFRGQGAGCEHMYLRMGPYRDAPGGRPLVLDGKGRFDDAGTLYVANGEDESPVAGTFRFRGRLTSDSDARNARLGTATISIDAGACKRANMKLTLTREYLM